MSESCYGNESNNVMEESNVVDDSEATEDGGKQLVLFDSKENDNEDEVQPIQSSAKTPCPSIGAFTVQCASCFKWRLMPSMQKYEEIREQLLENPFFCQTACEWNPDMSCDVPADISQDGTRLWAIDKPSIARPPTGWQRLLRIRGEGGTRFADVYYVAPSGKKLRSTVEVQKYLNDNPQYITEGVKLSQFSFQIPRPLQNNYVRKRPARPMESNDDKSTPVATEASPLAWISPDDHRTLQVGKPTAPGLYDLHEKPSKMARTSEPPTSGSKGDLAGEMKPEI